MKSKNNRIRRLLALYIDFGISLYPISIIIEYIEGTVFHNFGTFSKIFFSLIIIIICFSLILKKDTLFPNQTRSIGKIIFGLYIVDKNEKIVTDRELIEKKNKMTLTFDDWWFYLYRVLLFNESEAEDKLNIYLVTKKDVKQN